MASPTQWTGVWASSGRQWRTGKPGVLQSMGSQRVVHDLATSQQQPPLLIIVSCFPFSSHSISNTCFFEYFECNNVHDTLKALNDFILFILRTTYEIYIVLNHKFRKLYHHSWLTSELETGTFYCISFSKIRQSGPISNKSSHDNELTLQHKAQVYIRRQVWRSLYSKQKWQSPSICHVELWAPLWPSQSTFT